MRFIDTHTHIYLEQFDADRNSSVRIAVDAGVDTLIMPNVDAATIAPMMAVAAAWPGTCLPMIGLHPTSVKPGYEKDIEEIEGLLQKESFVAIGETGIDLYWDKTWLEEQKVALHRQAELALQYDLPLVLHSRKSLNEIFEVLRPFQGSKLRGVFHCFPGSIQEAERAVDMGFMLGIGGVVTYKNATMARVVEAMGLQHIVLETDAPYLPPVPHRGKRNESAYIPHIAQKVAELLAVTKEEVAVATTRNAMSLFRLPADNG